MFSSVIELFETRFGSRPSHVAHAPGRINLIGEHTDYNAGFVLPAAIDRRITFAARLNGTKTCRLFSKELGEGQEFSLPASLADLPEGWARFAASVAWSVGARTGIDVALCSNLPVASGVSSSAALEVGFACLWNEIEGLGLTAIGLAQAAQEAENEGIGVKCGIMDPLASAAGKAGCALLIDTRSLDVTPIPIPDDLCLLLCDTGKSRDLAGSAYNQRKSECEAACRQMGVTSVRDATLDDLDKVEDQTARRRARHVLTENQRVTDFALALKRCDLAALGRLMEESHRSLRDDFEVSCSELDAMVAACLQTRGVVGARMTGAGFGGACVAVAERETGPKSAGEIELLYRQEVKTLSGQVLVTEPSAGAQALRLE